VRVWGADEGLPATSVTDIAQTPEGYLWVGTLLAGLHRFDGVQFASYHGLNTPGFRGMAVRRLFSDRAGRLWFNTYTDALLTWTPAGFASAREEPLRVERLLWSGTNEVLLLAGNRSLWHGLRRQQAWQWEVIELPVAAQPRFSADAEGRLWHVQTNGALACWRPGQPRAETVEPPFPGQPVRVLTADAHGHVWLGTDRGAAVWRGAQWEKLASPPGDAPLVVKRIIPAALNGAWIEAGGRMRRWQGGTWLAESPGWIQDMGTAGPLAFAVGDRRGGFWAGYRDFGLLRVEPDGAFLRLTTRDGLPSDSLRLGLVDRDGFLWTGYERGGLVQIRPRLFEVLGSAQGLPEDLINSVSEDPDGALWLGTHRGTIVRQAEGQTTLLPLPPGVAGRDSVAAAGPDGAVWIGVVGGGLLRHTQGRLEPVLPRAQLQGDPRVLLPARDGQLWLATLDAIWTFKDGELRLRHRANPAGGQERPAALAQTTEGTIWAGTFSGALLRWTGNQFDRVEPPGIRELGRSWALWPARNGGLWIGTTDGGVLQLHENQFRRYTTRDGLPSDHIVQVMEDGVGNLWLATRDGICRVDEASLTRFNRGELPTLRVSRYGRADGLLTIGSVAEFQPNCARGRDGRLWFAMLNSVAAVDPAAVRLNPQPPTVVLEEARVDGARFWPTQSAAIHTADVRDRTPPALRTPAGKRDLEFRFTGLSFGAPERVRFQHQLAGLDADWIEAGGQRRAEYRYVPPGDYAFRLRAANSDGVWSDPVDLLRIRVPPHFYETGWFLGGLLVLGAGTLAWTVRRVTRRKLQRRLAELERQHALERERTRIAQDLHDDLGAALTEVGLLSSLAQRSTTPADRMREHLGHIATKARDMVTALDEIVWAVNPKHDSVAALGRYFSEYAQQFLQTTPLRCRIEVDDPLPAHPLNSEQRQNLLLAFKEALTNVVRHARASEVRLTIAVRDHTLLVTVADDGSGALPPVAAEQADGLVNMRRRLERVGGRCEVVSTPGRGTTVTFLYPLQTVAP